MVNELTMVKWNIESVPVKMYDTVAAVTLEMSNGMSDDMVRSMSSTSMVNTSPAIGALNIPATAPAAPQPTSSIMVRASTRNNLPKLDPIAEPVSTIGASAPTEPPKPIVIELATTDEYMLCGRMRACLREMA